MRNLFRAGALAPAALLPLLACLACTARAQTVGTFVPGTTISAAAVNAALGSKMDLTSTSPLLDMLGSTRGSVLYRGASGWAARTPGTSGQVFTSQGAGADPIWATLTSAGTVTSIGVTVPSGFAVAPSSITTSGTFAITWSGQIPAAQMPALTGAVTTSAGSTSTTLASGAVAYGNVTSGALASGANFQANAGSVLLTPNAVWASAAPATTTYASTVTLDFTTFIDTDLTLTGNVTLANPSSGVVGKKGRVRIVEDGTGGRTVTWGTAFKFASGTAPTLVTTAGAENWCYYDFYSSAKILVSCLVDVR